MRGLRVIGLHEDGRSVVCEDPANQEQFLLPADERLRAAARGDVTRLGQIEIELESQMRPREIQARIRAGDSVEQVATNANVPVERVERFAHPVLQERSRNAQLAQQAHPMWSDGPDVRTLGEIVSYTFGVRAQDYQQATWDAWRGDDGQWVVALRWQAGHTDNDAHFTFTPGPQGGTVTAIDEHAEDLLQPNTAPRGPRAVTVEFDTATRAEPSERPARQGAEDDTSNDEAASEDFGSPLPEHAVDGATAQEPVTDAEPDPAADPEPQPQRSSTAKKNHPVVPAWEDVLLGVRSQRG